MLHMEIERKCVVLWPQHTSNVFQPCATSGPLDSLSVWLVISILKLPFKLAILMQIASSQSRPTLNNLPVTCLSSAWSRFLPVSTATARLFLLPACPLVLHLTLHFALVSFCACRCPSSEPVRWNIGALLMIQQSFLYVSTHLFLIVKLLSAVDSRQAWFAFNSKAEGEPCSRSTHYLYCSHNKRETN